LIHAAVGSGGGVGIWLTNRSGCAAYAVRNTAVRAGLTEMWSNGQVEGQITRLKLIKRAMYGRASLDLLRRRVLERK
jgi:transposase